MIPSNVIHSILRNDDILGLLVYFDDHTVFEAFHRSPDTAVFREMRVLYGNYEEGVLSAVCLDVDTGQRIRFAYRLGDVEFTWGDDIYAIPSPCLSNVAIRFIQTPRITEQVFVADDFLVLVRANEDDHKESNRRMYVGNEDGTNMCEVALGSYVVSGDGSGATYVTREGDVLVARPLGEIDAHSTWNGERLFHVAEEQFVIDERPDRLFVGLKWPK